MDDLLALRRKVSRMWGGLPKAYRVWRGCLAAVADFFDRLLDGTGGFAG
jgi:hypothetical protein